MAKILETNLPFAQGEVTPELFNKLIRILEINLSAVDPDKIPSFTQTQTETLSFATGAIIFNTTNKVHQAFDGTRLRNLYASEAITSGFSGTISLGVVTVTIG